jgi:hypothetical protein
MATLLHPQTGVEHPLAARHVVGRSRACELQLESTSVSSLHAEITWDGRIWHLRDLGSRNGTFVEGRRIAAGQPIVLDPGVHIGFGAPSNDYRFTDASPPQLIAFGPDGPAVAQDDVLCLPTTDDPEVIVMCDASSRWIVEGREGSRPVDDEEVLVVRGVPYRVRLPGGAAPTRDQHEPPIAPPDPLDLGALALTVSHDAEHVDGQCTRGGRTYDLESRAHAFLLVELARARLEDQQRAELLESEHGWVHRDDLMHRLGIDDPALLNLWVFRARQQFIPVGLGGAVIERRQAAGQLRIGLRNLRIINR